MADVQLDAIPATAFKGVIKNCTGADPVNGTYELK